MIKDLKSLKHLLKICREQGVTEITLEGLNIKFGEMPDTADAVSTTYDTADAVNELTEQQLMFYSVEGAT